MSDVEWRRALRSLVQSVSQLDDEDLAVLKRAIEGEHRRRLEASTAAGSRRRAAMFKEIAANFAAACLISSAAFVNGPASRSEKV